MKTAVSIKLDRDVKRHAQKLSQDLGFSLSTVINAMLKEFVRQEQLVISTVPRMSGYLEELLGPIEKDIHSGKNLSKSLSTAQDVDQLFKKL